MGIKKFHMCYYKNNNNNDNNNMLTCKDMRVPALRKEASRKKIKGRSKMNKAQLCRNLGYNGPKKTSPKKRIRQVKRRKHAPPRKPLPPIPRKKSVNKPKRITAASKARSGKPGDTFQHNNKQYRISKSHKPILIKPKSAMKRKRVSRGCVKQTTKKYATRKSPPFPANE